jgi:hypothetical protein
MQEYQPVNSFVLSIEQFCIYPQRLLMNMGQNADSGLLTETRMKKQPLPE